MSNQHTMIEFTNLCKAGKFEEAGVKYWADDIASIEAAPAGDGAVVRGRKAVEEKGRKWAETTQLHGFKVEGPFPNGDQFALRFEMDITPKDQQRLTMAEIGIFTLKNGKIVEERFFYGS